MENVIIKECPLHGLTKFVLRKNNRYQCRKCSSMAVIKRRRKVKEELVKYKGNKCEICEYEKCIEALDFHHIDENEKEFTISMVSRSLSILKNEVDKCKLVCANCHREIHHEKTKKNIELVELKKTENIFLSKTKRNSYKKISLLDKELIKMDKENNLKQPEIAKKYGVSLSTLKRFMDKNDICFFRRK